MARTAWILEDPVTSEIYKLPANPAEDAGSNAIVKSVRYQGNSAHYRDSLGADRTFGTLVFSSNVELETFSYSGRLYSKEEFDAWKDWVARDYPVYLTDDLGRKWLVLFSSFKASRAPWRKYPWRHSYELSGTILTEVV